MATPIGLQQTANVSLDLSSNQINFVDTFYEGHRVRVPLHTGTANRFFRWIRSNGDSRAQGSVTDISNLILTISDMFTHTFTDLDGSSQGIHLSSSSLVNTSNRTNTFNDILLCYLLAKVYGKSSFDTENKVVNISQLRNQITNQQVAEAIVSSFQTQNDISGSIDMMFQTLVSRNPLRQFDGSGHQITGIFETSTNISASGSWGLVQGDVIQIPLAIRFPGGVTRQMVSSTHSESLQETILEPNTILPIRLQIICSNSAAPPTLPEPEPTENYTLEIINNIVSNYTGTLPSTLTLPSTIITITNYCFQGASTLQNIILPSSLLTIGDFAFADTGLTSITIPDSVLTINNCAFSNTPNLTQITIGSGITLLGQGIFQGTGLTSVDLQQTNINTFGNNTFRNSPITSFVFPQNLTTIMDSVFQDTQIAHIEIPSSVTQIGNYAFMTSIPTISIQFNMPYTPPSFSTSLTNVFNTSPTTFFSVIESGQDEGQQAQWQSLANQLSLSVTYV